ncbi:uncharacterized protein LOC111715860 [Eurytemora carolleeae]|uniref:uncharacterized protein LOC111715860 n=1 Tax=Eurytemora carolleeae TaxID=1294199 RepID=UPI000C766905|nr:uncharacterized protein LOC111715860 [Eurytemora carolleeae]|eukprot:XP_023347022.1 uncharacterized protein LOC111715860 [Eurytemora affinis]
MKANSLSPYNSEPHRSSENSYSPIAPGTLKAQESSIFSSCSVPGTDTFSGGLEKILLERLLLRKELKIRSMQSKLDSLGIDFQQCKEEKEKEIENLKRKLEEKEIVSNYFKSEYRNLERTPLLPTILLVLSVLSYTRSYIQRITATLLQEWILFLNWLLYWMYTVPGRAGEKACTWLDQTLSILRYKLSGVEHEEPGDKVGMDDLLQVQVLAGAQQIHLIQMKTHEQKEQAKPKKKKKYFHR